MDAWMSLRVINVGICMSLNNMSILSIGNIGGLSPTWVKDKVTMNIIGYSPYEMTTKRVF